MAPNAIPRALTLGLLLSLAACGGKKEEPPAVDLGAARARRDSVRKVAEADSIARSRFTLCSDSVLAVVTKTAAGKKRVASAPEGMIQPEVLKACGKPPTKLAPPVVAGAPKPDTGKVEAGTPPTPAAQAPGKPALTPQQQQVLRADSIRLARERTRQDSVTRLAERTREDSLTQAQSDSVRGDSMRLARETEVLRETFTYAGGARDPFASLISEDKIGPEFNDLILVGIYFDQRRANNSIAVLRDKTNQKRYSLRVGDRLGRLKVAQIRPKDVVFTVEDIGFERQETLSIRKREAETQ